MPDGECENMENMDAMLKSTVEIFSKIDHSKWINADIESIKLLTL